jgi:hypothetical protein
MSVSTFRQNLDSIRKHAEHGPEMCKWTPLDSLTAIRCVLDDIEQHLAANRLAPGSDFVLIRDPKPRRRRS